MENMLKRLGLVIPTLMLHFALAQNQVVDNVKDSEPIIMLRYLENYQFLNDTAKRIDFYDPIKYISLSKKNPARYISLGGDIRILYQRITNRFQGNLTSDGYLLNRFMLHTDWHQGKSFRMFTQFGSTWENGRMGGPRIIDEDQLFMHQLFVDITLPFGKSTKHILRIGRQEVVLGGGRLVTIREGPNTRLSFDGIRLLSSVESWHINSFYLRPVNNRKYAFDNKAFEQGRSIGGIYISKIAKPTNLFHVDFFFIGYSNENSAFHQGIGTEKRYTIGSRVFGKKDGYDFDLEGGYQFGSFEQQIDEGNISSYGLSLNNGYTFSNLLLKPRFGFKFDYISGDKDPNNPDLQTVNTLFPKQGYFRGAAALAPSNMIHIHPELTLNFNKNATLVIDWSVYWRTSLRDGIYAPSNIPINSLSNGKSHYLGNQLDFEFFWQYNRNFSLLAVYSHFFAGQAVKDNPYPAEMADFINLYVGYKF